MKVKLSNIIVEDGERFYQEPSLYCLANKSIQPGEDGVIVLGERGTFDFSTFMNGLSVQKLQKYTLAQGFSLHIEYRGGMFGVVQTHGGLFDQAPRANEAERYFDPSLEWTSVDLDVEVLSDDIVIGYRFITFESGLELRNLCYEAVVDEKDVRDVELALCTTTFRKEDFVKRNVRMVKESILGGDDAISKHFTMHVVDNGRTLDASEIECDGIHLHPNPNAGGSGGFARGMIEAMEQTPKATHVLLMDDDVSLSAESIKRTYNLLRIVRDEYADAFLSGAMMTLEEPDVLWEDLGYMDPLGGCLPLKDPVHMGHYPNVVANETFDYEHTAEIFDPSVQVYAGWWYCVIPMTQVEKNGLPLPLFVRFDDIEYGLRCKPRFMSMNGICVWHMGFSTKYSAAVERYQTTRNSLVAQFVSDVAPHSNLLTRFYHMGVQLDLKKFNYADASLALDGFEDFLKGPSFVMEPGKVEERFMYANKNVEKRVPYDVLVSQAAELGVDITTATTWQIVDEPDRSKVQAAVDLLTFGGQRGPKTTKGKTAIIDAAGWVYPAGKLHGADTVIAIDSVSGAGTVRRLDRDKFKQVISRYNTLMKEYRRNKARLKEAYAAAGSRMKSVAFWKQYLGI